MKRWLSIKAVLATFIPAAFAGDFIPEQDDYAKKLLSPNWDVVEEYFGKPVPRVLKAFYQNPKKVLRVEFNLANRKIAIPEGIFVSSFDPIGPASVDGFFEGFEQYISFASDGGGGIYVINIAEENPKVYYHIYDIGEDPKHFRYTGLLLSDFLASKTVKAKE